MYSRDTGRGNSREGAERAGRAEMQRLQRPEGAAPPCLPLCCALVNRCVPPPAAAAGALGADAAGLARAYKDMEARHRGGPRPVPTAPLPPPLSPY